MMQGLLEGGAMAFKPPDPFAHYMDCAPDPDDPFNTAHCDGCGADMVITTEGVRQATRQIHRWCKYEEGLI